MALKKAIIIGASSGIGSEIAKLLVKRGYMVGVTGRRRDLLEKMQSEKPERFVIKNFDIQDVANIAENLNELVAELGGLDLLIISAGTGSINKQLDFAVEKDTLQTNVLGFIAVADWAFNLFQTQGSGHLVGISSVAGLRGNKEAPAYNASKAFQINYLEGLRQKTTKNNQITVTDIRPGFVDTRMAQGEGLFWVSSAQRAAEQILQAIEAKKSIVYVTKRWRLVAWILHLLPSFVYNRL